MFKIINRQDRSLIPWYAAAAIKRGQLVIEDTGAKPCTVELATQVIIGLATNDAAIGEIVYVMPLNGAILEVPYLSSATDQTLTDADIGTDYDIDVTDGDMTLDTDDTSGFLYLVGYDNTRKIAKVIVPNTKLLVG